MGLVVPELQLYTGILMGFLSVTLLYCNDVLKATAHIRFMTVSTGTKSAMLSGRAYMDLSAPCATPTVMPGKNRLINHFK